MDPGAYGIYQGGTQKGCLYVEAGANPNTTKEHWVLYPGYVSPSLNGSNQPIDDLIVKACQGINLTPNAQNVRSNGVNSLGDFFAIMRDHQNNFQNSFTYILADCALSTGVPSSP